MTSPLVGTARIEVIGDVGPMAAEMEAEVKAAVAGVNKTIQTEGAKTTAIMGEQGAAAGEAWTRGADGKLRNAKGQFVSSSEQAAAGMETTMAKSGEKAGAGFVTSLNKILGTSFSGGTFTAAAAVGIGLVAAKMAGDFQSQMTRLVTAAGESEAAMGMISKGVLQIAAQTGTSTKSVADGMYMIESAGFHGADALNVMKAAAQGAKVDMADVGVVGDALTTAMIDLHQPTAQAATVMSQLVATVGHGKTTMDLLAGSLHSVLPNAAALGLGMGQVGGAIATMTAQGISADQATQNLNHTILSLANPTALQTKAMAAFGLNATTVAQNIGKNGLDGTLQQISQTILNHMGPAGLTLTNAMNTSQIAAGKANTMFANLPAPVQSLAKQLQSGALTMNQYRTAIGSMTDTQANLGRQWLMSYNRAQGFNDLLKSSSPDALTYTAALSKMVGGQTGLQVALHLTGENMATYKDNIKTIGAASADASGNVQDWAIKQKTFNQQMSELKEQIATSTISLGTMLLPALTSLVVMLNTDVIPALQATGQWLADNRGWVEPLVLTIGSLVAAYKAYQIVMATARAVTIAYKVATGELVVVEEAKDVVVGKSTITTGLNTIATIANRVASLAAAAATRAWAAAVWVFNAAMDANPITLIVIGLVALGVALYEAYQHFGPFRAIVDDVGRALKTGFVDSLHAVKIAVADTVQFFEDHWKLIATIVLTLIAGPFGFAIMMMITHFSQVKAAVLDVVSAVTGAFMTAFHAVADVITTYVMPPLRLYIQILRDIALVYYAVVGIAIYGLIKLFQLLANMAMTVLVPAFNFIQAVFQKVAGAISRAWNVLAGALTTAWRAFAGVAAAIWGAITGAIARAWNAEMAGLQRIWNAASGAISRAWNAFAGTAARAWDAITGAVSQRWDNLWATIRAGWSAVSSFLSRAWATFSTTASTAWHHILDPIGKIWGDVTTAIGTAWGKLSGVFLSGVNGVIGVVNKFIGGIDSLLGKLPGNFHIDQITAIKLATGGVVPGSGTGDSVHAMLTPGEGVLNTGAMAAIGSGTLHALNNTYGGPSKQGGNHFAGGGIPGLGVVKNIGGAIGGVGRDVLSLSRDVAADAAIAAMNSAEAPIKIAMNALPNAIMRNIGTGTLNDINSSVKSWINGHAVKATAPASGGAYNGGGAAQWKTMVDQVLMILGLGLGQEGAILARIDFESGGNPNAINLTDSNAVAGHPSQGLLQTIPSTFFAYAGPYASRGITDPFANIYAGVNYAEHRYGGMPDPRITHQGYDSGGMLMPGVTLAMNGSGKPEQVFSDPQMERLVAALEATAGGGAFKVIDMNGRYVMTLVNNENKKAGARR